VVLTLQDELAGKKVRCPQCGATIQVPGVGQARPPEGPAAAPAAPSGAACKHCGAVLAPGSKLCAACGTVAGARKRPVRKKAGSPGALVAVGVFLLVAVLAGAGIFVGLKLSGGGESAEPDPADGAEASPPAGRDVPGTSERATSAGATEVQLQELRDEEERLGPLVGDYLNRLAEVANARDTSRNDTEWAKHWANLYEFCAENGLETEAQMCWLKAAMLAPRDRTVNGLLGRTEMFRGYYVTADQKRYLESIQGAVRVVNRDLALRDLEVALPEGTLRALPPAQSWEVSAPPGPLTLRLETVAQERRCSANLPVEVEPGCLRTVTFPGNSDMPVARLGNLPLLYKALLAWQNSQRDGGGRGTGSLVDQGWRKTADGEWAKTADNVRVTLGVDDEGKLVSVGCGDVTLVRARDAGPSIAKKDAFLKIEGELESTRKRQSFKLIGTADEPAILQLTSDNSAWVRGGEWERGGQSRKLREVSLTGAQGRIAYQVSSAPLRSAEQLLAALSEQRSRALRHARLAEQYQERQAQVKDLEARGQLLGDWHSQLWIEGEMHPVRMREWNRINQEAKARRLPPYARGLDASQDEDRLSVLHREWPMFREALTTVMGRVAAQAVAEGDLACVPLMNDADAVALVDTILRPPIPEEPLVPMMPGTAAPWPAYQPDGPPDVGRRATQEPARQAAVTEPGNERLASTIRQLRTMHSPAVIGCLDRMASGSSDFGIRAEALVVLGEIGTRDSLKRCRMTAISPTVTIASLAALAGAGDKETLDSLPETLKANPEFKEAFLDYLLRIDSPTAVLALQRVIDLYRDPKPRERIAHRLGTMGGHSAAMQLARLFEAPRGPYFSALGKIRSPERTLLFRHMVRIIRRKPKKGQETLVRSAAYTLANTGSPLALSTLKAAAGRTPPRVGGPARASMGSAEAIEAAERGIGVVHPEQMQTIREHWQRHDAPMGKWALRDGVDSAAAVEFLHALLAESRDPEVRIVAAELLADIGSQPDVEALCEIAAVAVPGDEPALALVSAPTVMPGPPDAEPPMEVMVALRHSAQRQDDAKDKVTARRERLASEPPIRAFRLLEDRIEPDVGQALRKLSEAASTPEVRGIALRLLGLLDDESSRQCVLSAAGGVEGEYRSTKAMIDDARKRAAAAGALAAAEDAQCVDVLLALLAQPSPPKSAFKRQPTPEQYDSALDERKQVVMNGASEALAMLPRGVTVWDVAADQGQAEALVDALAAAAAEGARSIGKTERGAHISADAIRALGGCGRLNDKAWESVRAIVDFEMNEQTGEAWEHRVVQAALLEAMADLGEEAAFRFGTFQFAALRDPRLRDHWGDLCVKLADRGMEYDYRMITRTCGALPSEALKDVVAVMSARRGTQIPAYYDCLAALAGLPTKNARRASTAIGPVATPAARKASSASRSRRGRQPPKAAIPKLRKLPKPTIDPWLEEVKLRARCLDLLAEGPAGEVSFAIQFSGLLGDPLLGCRAALIVQEKDQRFSLRDYLRSRLVSSESAQQDSALLCAARAAGERELLAHLLLTKKVGAERSRSQAQPGRVPAPSIEDLRKELEKMRPNDPDRAILEWVIESRMAAEAGTGPEQGVTEEGKPEPEPVRLSPSGLRQAARALGSLGDLETLDKALRSARGRAGSRYVYPGPVRQAAVRGLAYLPPGKDPLRVLSKYSRSLPGVAMRRACEAATLSVMDIQAREARLPEGSAMR